jgi:NADH-ubiquinone oxidoreductase chain 5
MFLLIIFLPLLGSIITTLFGRFLGFQGVVQVTAGCIFAALLLSIYCFYEVALAGSPCYIKLSPWIESELLDVQWGFMFDSLTMVMLIIVTFISTLVHIYSYEYMGDDPHLVRFMAFLSLFTFFMLVLVTADNFIQMFIGWEGVGLCSYLLINFWFSRIQANKAAIKAMLVNRVGDFCMVLGILILFYVFKSTHYSVIFALAPYLIQVNICFLNFEFTVLTVACFLLFIGAVGKSSQLFLHTWLPDAMEGPTPVSALIHAATMVTAGVFLLARCSPIFEYAPSILILITVSGAMTAFFGATTGLLQNDLKRVIAYSTCSQLGYMIFICGISNYSVAVFHLSNHAFFKALLFLGAGSVIHAMGDEQDMRKMGGLFEFLPLTYAMLFIGSLALMGFPFLTGFYSKDVILELAYSKYTVSSRFAYWLGTLSAFFTAFYSMRLLFLVFYAEVNAYKQILLHVHDAPVLMSVSLILLSLGSICLGYITKDMIIGMGTSFWGNALFTLPENVIIIDSEFMKPVVKAIPVIFSLAGAFLAFILYTVMGGILFDIKTSFMGRKLYTFLNRKWFFDKVYNDFIASGSFSIGYYLTYKVVDRGFIEKAGPFGLTLIGYNLSLFFSRIQSGYVFHYAFILFIALILFMLSCIHNHFFSFFVFLDKNILNLLMILLFLNEYFLNYLK